MDELRTGDQLCIVCSTVLGASMIYSGGSGPMHPSCANLGQRHSQGTLQSQLAEKDKRIAELEAFVDEVGETIKYYLEHDKILLEKAAALKGTPK